MWRGDLAEGTEHLQKARELDPNFSEAQSDFGIGFYNREQFRAAMQNSDCDGVALYGNKIISAAPDDVEVKKAISDCTLKRIRQPMRAALQKSDCGMALSLANKLLALDPHDEEALQAAKQCNVSGTHPH